MLVLLVPRLMQKIPVAVEIIKIKNPTRPVKIMIIKIKKIKIVMEIF